MDKRIKFNDNGTLKIMQLTDLHYEDEDADDRKTLELMARLLEWEQPDLVMVTGDAATGEHTADGIRKVLQPICDAGVSFSYVFGNHDAEAGAAAPELAEIVRSLSGCLMGDEREAGYGVGNHIIPVENKQGQIKWLLAGIDSGMDCPEPHVGGYDYVRYSQIYWYQQKLKELEKKAEDFSSLLFLHIPVREYQEVWETGTCVGTKEENVEAADMNSGLFVACVDDGHTRGMFAGHDHVNDYIGRLRDIYLAYGRVSGYGGYSSDRFLKGARCIVLQEQRTDQFETYIRLGDGSVIDRICCGREG